VALFLGPAEKVSESCGEVIGGVFGHVVTAMDGQSLQVRRPGLPDGQDVAVELLQVLISGPGHQGGAGQLPPGGVVGVVVGRAVDPSPAR